MWKTEAWDAVRQCFPRENKGSGILLTTRNNEVARYAGTKNSLPMRFMDQDESWNLFRSVAFSSEEFPSDLETIGKQITDECHGLPLTIVVVAGLLKSKMPIEYWESVAKDVKSFVTNDPDERCSSVLGLSYDHLTNVLKTCLLHFGIFPEDNDIPVKRLILSLFWLRYLSFQCGKKVDIHPEICRLWNLQTFIVKGPSLWKITFPEEILGLMQLRHLKLPEFYLPNPPSVSADKGSHMGFSNIQTISYLSPCCCTKEFIMRIQNVKELGLSAYWIDSDGLLNNLVHLQQLGTLSLTFRFGGFLPASAKAFPATLKKLKLKSTYLSWSYLDIIAELPNLEVLKLMYGACVGEEWRPTVMGFNRLKLLFIEHNDLKFWKATDDNFPVLERLVFRCCYYLDKIPVEFAEIHTLQLIELRKCPPKLGDSAARIQQEQEELGNNPFELKDVSLVGHALNLHSE
ncbi:hypothetical protein T459_24272 [Capsicum annuum]|uniref:NB-ARC domain-containing protein n=1 Tax=Capsicum annuum TaxID=4072 RepID=A0A2G2YUN3_CAPAN|nr:hypothetical protein T459_24272 [Capsicum annuum]